MLAAFHEVSNVFSVDGIVEYFTVFESDVSHVAVADEFDIDSVNISASLCNSAAELFFLPVVLISLKNVPAADNLAVKIVCSCSAGVCCEVMLACCLLGSDSREQDRGLRNNGFARVLPYDIYCVVINDVNMIDLVVVACDTCAHGLLDRELNVRSLDLVSVGILDVIVDLNDQICLVVLIFPVDILCKAGLDVVSYAIGLNVVSQRLPYSAENYFVTSAA